MGEAQDFVVRAAAPGGGTTDKLAAFGELVRRYQDMAYGYAYAILGDFHLAEDATQEAFITAFRRLQDVREPQAFPGWLRRLVRTACSRMTRRKQPPTTSLAAAAEVRSSTDEPARTVEKIELREAVLDAVHRLPEPQREVTTLFYINGYSQETIADFLEVPVTTVKNRLGASRKRLKKRMLDMVSQELHAAKPGPEFVARIQSVVRLRKDGQGPEAYRVHRSLIADVTALQRKGLFKQAVRAHGAIVAAIRADGTYPDMWSQMYRNLAPSYYRTGKALELAEGILASLPAPLSAEDAACWAGKELAFAAEVLLKAGKPRRAREVASHLVQLLEEIVSGMGADPSSRGACHQVQRMVDETRALVQAAETERAIGQSRRVLEVPEVMLFGLPSEPSYAEAEGVAHILLSAVQAFHKTARFHSAAEQAQRMLEVLKVIEDLPVCRFLRGEALSELRHIALKDGNEARASRLLGEIYDNLAAYEQDLAGACPGLRCAAETKDKTQQEWFRELGDAYHNFGHRVALWRWADKAEALRLLRRAAEVREFAPTHIFLARLVLSVERNRKAALAHLKKAVEDGEFRNLLERELRQAPEFEPVREDPEFLAVIST